MENFEFEDKFNPWDVNNLDDFRFYYCPECDFRNVTKNDFIKHAVTSHPKSHDVIDKLEGKKCVKQEKNKIIKAEKIEIVEINDDENVSKTDKIQFQLKEVKVTLHRLNFTEIQRHIKPKKPSKDNHKSKVDDIEIIEDDANKSRRTKRKLSRDVNIENLNKKSKYSNKTKDIYKHQRFYLNQKKISNKQDKCLNQGFNTINEIILSPFSQFKNWQIVDKPSKVNGKVCKIASFQQCELCNFMYFSRMDLCRHFLDLHLRNMLEEQFRTHEEVSKLMCPKCPLIFNQQLQRFRHYVWVHLDLESIVYEEFNLNLSEFPPTLRDWEIMEKKKEPNLDFNGIENLTLVNFTKVLKISCCLFCNEYIEQKSENSMVKHLLLHLGKDFPLMKSCRCPFSMH